MHPRYRQLRYVRQHASGSSEQNAVQAMCTVKRMHSRICTDAGSTGPVLCEEARIIQRPTKHTTIMLFTFGLHWSCTREELLFSSSIDTTDSCSMNAETWTSDLRNSLGMLKSPRNLLTRLCTTLSKRFIQPLLSAIFSRALAQTSTDCSVT